MKRNICFNQISYLEASPPFDENRISLSSKSSTTTHTAANQERLSNKIMPIENLSNKQMFNNSKPIKRHSSVSVTRIRRKHSMAEQNNDQRIVNEKQHAKRLFLMARSSTPIHANRSSIDQTSTKRSSFPSLSSPSKKVGDQNVTVTKLSRRVSQV